MDSTSSHEKNYKQPVAVDVVEVDAESLPYRNPNTHTQRGLKGRHIQLIALAGAIGTGLFVGSGSGLATCGPGALFIGYFILCIFVWGIMNLLGEMVTYIPNEEKSTLYGLCERYTGNKSFAFAAGMNLFYAQALIAPAEISASAFVIQYWSDLNVAIWISIFWVCLTVLNFCAVQFFGESEFWIGSIKVITITGLIILGIVLFFGGGPEQHGVLGFHYWKHPRAFNEHLTSGNTGRFLSVWTAIIKSAFAFILAPELITSCAAEAQAPRINLPKATSRFVYRLIFFYVCGVLVIGIIVSSDDDRLMSAINQGASGAAASPFVIGIQNAGIKYLNHIVNAAILTSAFSCGNSLIFSASRTLHSMALNGNFFAIFATTNKQGVPYYCVGLTCLISLVAYLNCSSGSTKAFTWLSNISTVSGFISWLFSCVTYLRFRKAITYHGMDEKVTFRPPLQFFACYSSLVFFTIISLTNGYAVFFDFNASDFFAAYITIPIVILCYVIHAVVTKNYRLFADPSEIDVVTGLAEAEKEAAEYVAPVPRNFIEKIWFWIA